MFRCRKVRRHFHEPPLTHTVTHITIVYSGHDSTKGCFLATKSTKCEKPSGFYLKFLIPKLCISNNFALGLSADNPGRYWFLAFC